MIFFTLVWLSVLLAGWCLERVGDVITDPILLEQYIAIADYKKQRKNEVNLKEGGLIEVVEKNENGTCGEIS